MSDEFRPFSELKHSGLLWLINRVVFHPRGWALGLQFDGEGNAVGWDLVGDGREVWTFNDSEDEVFNKVQALLAPVEANPS